jgi:hypothetical protein
MMDKLQTPVILSVIHNHQNPSDSIWRRNTYAAPSNKLGSNQLQKFFDVERTISHEI